MPNSEESSEKRHADAHCSHCETTRPHLTYLVEGYEGRGERGLPPLRTLIFKDRSIRIAVCGKCGLVSRVRELRTPGGLPKWTATPKP